MLIGKNKFKMYKKALCLIFAFLLSIESFAAVVSDNDGSAFITKAEFDSLKNEFQSQLDNYNTAIDAKLDEAISAYLTGISVKSKQNLTSIINSINESTAYDKGWFPMCKTFSPITTKKPVNGQLAMNIVVAHGGGGAVTDNYRGSFAFSLNLQHSDGLVRDTLKYVDIPSAKTDGLYYVFNVNRANGFKTYSNTYVNMSYKELLAGVSFGYAGGYRNMVNSYVPTSWVLDELKNEQSIWTAVSTTAHCYFTSYTSASVTESSHEIGAYSLWIPSYEATNTQQIWPIMGACSTSNNIFALDADKYAVMTVSPDKSTYQMGYKGYVLTTQSGTGKTYGTKATTLGDQKFSFYYNYHPYEKIAMTDLGVAEIATQMNNKKYPFYCGLPLCAITDDGTVTMELKFHSASGNAIKYAIKSETFTNDASYASDTTLNIRKTDGTAITSFEVNDNATLQIKLDVKKGTELWIKTYDAGSDTGYTGVETLSISEEFT